MARPAVARPRPPFTGGAGSVGGPAEGYDRIRTVPERRGDQYLAAAERAIRRPGRWINVRVFSGEKNARVTAWAMERGFVRNRPRDGQEPIQVGGQMCIALPCRPKAEVAPADDGWLLRIRAPKRRPMADQ